MADFEEELDPLFDYRRIQPKIVCIDDGDRDVSKKRKKTNITADNVDVDDYDDDDDEVQIIEPANVKDKAEEEDWLCPPPKPKVSNNSRTNKTSEDSLLKELRLKKKELLSMLSVEDVDVRKASSEVAGQQQPSKPPCKRPKVIVSIQDKDGQKNYRVYKDDKLERLFKSYAETVKLNIETLVFCFDGEKISSMETPDGLGLEDNDIIEVHMKKGCSEVAKQEQGCSEVAKQEQRSKPTRERPKVIVSIQDKNGPKNYRVYKDDKLERLFKSYAEKVKVDIKTLVFSFDGNKISSTQTPDWLGLEDNDIIEVHIKKR